MAAEGSGSTAWYRGSFRRNLVDMHIDDWNGEFLSMFDSAQYLQCLKAGHIQSPMIYLQSHVGLCNWPTQSGRMHSGFRGVNKVGQLIDLCHAEGMDVVGYYSLIYNNWAYENHPEWRMRDGDGRPSRNDESSGFLGGGRYGLVCPNHRGYREFVFRQFGEIIATYRLEGVFLDMTFWPMVCRCPACRDRFRLETGRGIPETIDWNAPVWRQFQAKREEWLNEFASACTAELKRLQPGLSVEHQLSTIHQDWVFGVNEGINEASDYAGGDLHGGYRQESFICKLYYEITKNQPFEYMTSRCDPDLLDHTTTKPPEALMLHAFLALAHHGATLFIDAIDPRGTLNPKVYETIGKVFAQTAPYEKYLTGRLVSDVAVYFNLESRMDARRRGEGAGRANPQLDAALGMARALSESNHLYTVVSSCDREKARGKKAILVSEAAFLSDGEIDFFSDYVVRGGCLYIGGNTRPELARRLLGLEFIGYTDEDFTYLAPTAEGREMFGDAYSPDYPLACREGLMKVSNPLQQQVLATVTLPYTNPGDAGRFASIHSNPPGVKTDFPAVVFGRYGKGRVVWSAAPIEKSPQRAHRDVLDRMLRRLLGCAPALSSSAPPCVEFTVFEDDEQACLYVHAVNVQEQTPVIPAGGFSVSLRTEKRVRSVSRLPEESQIGFTLENGVMTFKVERLDLFAMFRVQ